MKVELIEDNKHDEIVKVTFKKGNFAYYSLTKNESLLVGLIIGLQDEVTALSKKIKGSKK